MSKIKFSSEKELEDSICEFIEENGKCPLTLKPVTHWYRQVKIGSYGVADIVKIYIDDLCFLHNQLNDLISIYAFEMLSSKGFEVGEITNKWRRDYPEFNDDGSGIIDDIRNSVKESLSTLVDSENKK